jgi:hypothetical protein
MFSYSLFYSSTGGAPAYSLYFASYAFYKMAAFCSLSFWRFNSFIIFSCYCLSSESLNFAISLMSYFSRSSLLFFRLSSFAYYALVSSLALGFESFF